MGFVTSIDSIGPGCDLEAPVCAEIEEETGCEMEPRLCDADDDDVTQRSMVVAQEQSVNQAAS